MGVAFEGLEVQNMKKFVSVVLALIMMSVVLLGCTGGGTTTENGGRTESNGKTQRVTELVDINSFSAKTTGGDTFTEKDLAPYDLTVINFWATFCAPCLKEMPALAMLQKKLPKNIQLITVCLDANKPTNDIDAILVRSKLDGITLVSGKGNLNKLMMQVTKMPTTVFVDSNGNMVLPELIGSPKNLEETYIQLINQALKGMGKAPI
jgi:thiol-disulfide isomerase/thioredoxin